ncbi:hypothetical protein Bache_2661 [Bacteroides helcogenes P 36-108]|uniref:Uncharacterized protein n=1 Tax=Bacteroides helcogenes (strain ATCC 35417 / DSM 20613 / JCM 6297 / CCUG 15421 / P 36-108) TaxID=693979 RepID=E6SWF1_BACT6|nr:hypothetical protein Bache_2661 [Bacteroides helcogenes P 36-108]
MRRTDYKNSVMKEKLLKYIILSWAVIGIYQTSSTTMTVGSLMKKGDTSEKAVERYVV